MSSIVYLDIQTGIIHTSFYGPVSKQDVLDATSKAFSLVEGKGPHRFLTELVDVTLKLNIPELLGAPDQWDELGFSRSNKLAIIVTDEKLIDEVRLYVANCRRRAWRVDRFLRHQTAVNWLLS